MAYFHGIQITEISGIAGGTVSPNPLLAPLVLSGPLRVGVPTSGTISGALNGSSIVMAVPGVTVDSLNRTYVGTPSGPAATITNGLVEISAGASNSPNPTPVSVLAALPTVALSADVTQAEGSSGAKLFTFTVTRSATAGAATVPWTFSPGTTSAADYSGGVLPVGASVSLADGVASGTFSISVNGDVDVESDETFTVAIAPPSGYGLGSKSSATGTITNDDTPALPTVTISADVSQPEGNSGPKLFTFTATRSVTAGAVNVPWGFSAGATNAADYTGGALPSGGSVALADGVASGTFVISVNGDADVESDEAFTVTISAPSGYTLGTKSSATGTIVNEDVAVAPTPTVTLSADVSQPEGNSGAKLFTFTVTRSTAIGAVSVPWSFAAGATIAADYSGSTIPGGGSVSLADGVASGTFVISVNGDTDVEPDETFTVTISAPTGYALGSKSSAAGTIANDDAAAPTVVTRLLPSLYAGASQMAGAQAGATLDTASVLITAGLVGKRVADFARDYTLPTNPATAPLLTSIAVSGNTYVQVKAEQVDPNASANVNWLIYSSVNDLTIEDGVKFQTTEAINTQLASKNVCLIGGHNGQQTPAMSATWFTMMRQNRRNTKYVRQLNTPRRIASSFNDAWGRWTSGPSGYAPTATDVDDVRWGVIPTSLIGLNGLGAKDDLHSTAVGNYVAAKHFAQPCEEAWANGVPYASFMEYFFRVAGAGPNRLLGPVIYTCGSDGLTGCTVASLDSRFEFKIESGKINVYLTGTVPSEDYNDVSFTITKAGVPRTWTIRLSVSARTTLMPAMRRIANRTMIVTNRPPDGVTAGTKAFGVWVLAREDDPGAFLGTPGNPDVNSGAAGLGSLRHMQIHEMFGMVISWRSTGTFQLTVKDSTGANICNTTSTTASGMVRGKEHGPYALFWAFDYAAGLCKLVASGGTYVSGPNVGQTYGANSYDYPILGTGQTTGFHSQGAAISAMWGSATSNRATTTPKTNYLVAQTGLQMLVQDYNSDLDPTNKANRLKIWNEDSTAVNRHVLPATSAYRYTGMTVDPFFVIAGDAAEIYNGSETSPASSVLRGGAWSKNHGTGGDMEYCNLGYGRMLTLDPQVLV